ncbi:MAG: hypothetical protein BWY06_03246 [Candidatus Latescibacteria bacterium ADurb.Bin168]|nr:MAG: hypothetical protein BWY06_03246 [Candidatus Latescibacteria bacterium ADurb.Bin168]
MEGFWAETLPRHTTRSEVIAFFAEPVTVMVSPARFARFTAAYPTNDAITSASASASIPANC